MKNLLNSLVSRSTSRRPQSRSPFGFSLENFEDRTLLSGVAIYPQPAAAVVVEDVAPAAVLPADFSGEWNIFSSQGNGTANITQDGNKIDVLFSVGALDFEGSGKVKGETAKGKVKLVVFGETVKGKITVILTSPTTLNGVATVKKSPIGKLELPFNGERTVM